MCKILFYGVVWLFLLNPCFVVVYLHLPFEENGWTTVILMLVSVLYYKFVWMKVRARFIEIDQKFYDLYFGRNR